MNLRLLLLPFSAIYAAIMMFRNMLYDHRWLHTCQFTKPVICVGNITVGGTGKTPFIEHLIMMLSEYKPSVVSRGYKRKTKGLVIANTSSTAATIGDEPIQMHCKYPNIPLVVDENRTEGINYLFRNTNTGVVLMDDGFQHRSTTAGMYILITDYARPMWNDFTFPAGNMREPWIGRHRADMIVVNKCPHNLTQTQKQQITQKLNVNVPVFFATIEYADGQTLNGEKVDLGKIKRAIAVAGIGRPTPFFAEVKNRIPDVTTHTYPDHYQFSPTDINSLFSLCQNENRTLITTEKDAMRLREFVDNLTIAPEFVVYLPIRLRILFGEEDKLNTKILQYVRKSNSAD